MTTQSVAFSQINAGWSAQFYNIDVIRLVSLCTIGVLSRMAWALSWHVPENRALALAPCIHPWVLDIIIQMHPIMHNLLLLLAKHKESISILDSLQQLLIKSSLLSAPSLQLSR